MSTPDLVVERPVEYSLGLATEVGRLRAHMSGKYTGEPIEEHHLRSILESPDSDLIIVKNGLQIIASSVLSLRKDINRVRGWLEGVVVHTDFRGSGAADAMADEWERWNREKGSMVMHFTSKWDRTHAHKFYHRRGAYIINSHGKENGDRTAFFQYPIPAAA